MKYTVEYTALVNSAMSLKRNSFSVYSFFWYDNFLVLVVLNKGGGGELLSKYIPVCPVIPCTGNGVVTGGRPFLVLESVKLNLNSNYFPRIDTNKKKTKKKNTHTQTCVR